jgi:hypothetical protein
MHGHETRVHVSPCCRIIESPLAGFRWERSIPRRPFALVRKRSFAGRDGPDPMDHSRSTCSPGLITTRFRSGESTMAALFPCIQDPGKGVNSGQMMPRSEKLPFGNAFLNGENSPPADCSNVRCGEVSLFRGELALIRSPGAGVSRSIGKFDTTATRRWRQVRSLVLPWQSGGKQRNAVDK